MKIIKHFLLITVLLCAGKMQGQSYSNLAATSSCYSTLEEYGNCYSKVSIVRSDNTHEVILSKDAARPGQTPFLNSPLTHTFIITEKASGLTVTFTTDFNAYSSEYLYDCQIFDMEIYKGICYFCGRVVYDIELFIHGNPYPEYETKGFVGCFSIDGMMNSIETVHYHEVPGTYMLNQIAINTPTADNYNTVVMAVGERDNEDTTSCVVELVLGTNLGRLAQWYQTLEYLQDNPEEYFTDVLSLNDRFILSTRIKGAGDTQGHGLGDFSHWSFQLHKVTPNGLHYDFNNQLYKEIAHYYIWGNGYWHINDVTMRLCPMNDHKFCLSYGVCVDPVLQRDGGMRLLCFDSIYTSESGMYFPVGHNTTILDTRCDTIYNRMFLVTADDDHSNGLAHHPLFGGGSSSVIVMESQNNKVLSTEIFHGEDVVCISGYKHNSSLLRLLRQKEPNIQESSCFNWKTVKYTPGTRWTADRLDRKWLFEYELVPFDWDEAEPIDKEIDISTICTKCD